MLHYQHKSFFIPTEIRKK